MTVKQKLKILDIPEKRFLYENTTNISMTFCGTLLKIQILCMEFAKLTV